MDSRGSAVRIQTWYATICLGMAVIRSMVERIVEVCVFGRIDVADAVLPGGKLVL